MTAASYIPDKAIGLVTLLAGQLVTPFIRSLCAALAAGYVLLGYQPLANPAAAALNQPIFAGVFTLADPRAWGVMFLTVAVLLALTALTGRAGLYLIAITAATVTLGAWASTIFYTALTVPDAELTLAAVGLYVIDFVAIIGLAMSPRQLVTPAAESAARRNSGEDDTVVELRQRTASGA